MGWRNKKDDKEELSLIPPLPPVLMKKQEEERETVVTELPQLPTRKIRGDDGVVYNLTTQNEAIQEILESVREILKIAKED